jgi:hypothetical protein
LLLLAVIAGCDEEDVIEPDPPNPCAGVLRIAFDKCMEGCGGLGCFIVLGECMAEAADQEDQCCRTMGGCPTTIGATEVSSENQPATSLPPP